MDKTELLKLAERVEALSGPDREVDKLIAVENGWCLHPSDRQRDDSAQSDTCYTCLDCGADSWGNTGPTGQKRSAPLPAYTASLDAAMTLCQPDENRWPQIEYIGHNPNNIKDGHRVRLWFNAKKVSGQSMVSAALALCAAALRALAKEEG